MKRNANNDIKELINELYKKFVDSWDVDQLKEDIKKFCDALGFHKDTVIELLFNDNPILEDILGRLATLEGFLIPNCEGLEKVGYLNEFDSLLRFYNTLVGFECLDTRYTPELD